VEGRIKAVILKAEDASPEDLEQLATQVPAAKPAAWEQSPIPVREPARRRIAASLFAGHIILVAGILIYVLCEEASECDSTDLFTLLITSYTTLLGSALAYYFGRQEKLIGHG